VDVVVIGGGIVGCSVALELARRGHSVHVVERGAGPGLGSTSASSAIVRFHYSTWTGVAVSWEARAGWLDWAEHVQVPPAVAARLMATGCLVLDAPAFDTGEILALLREAQVPCERWDAREIRQHAPAISPERFWPPKKVTDDEFWTPAAGELSGFFTPDAGFVSDPQLAAQNLREAAERYGAQFSFQARVVAVPQKAGRVLGVDLADGTRLRTSVVINAAGPHSGYINVLAHVLDDFARATRPMRQEVHSLPATEDYNLDDPRSPVVNDMDLGIYFRPHFGNSIIVGGMEPACDELMWVDDPDEFNPAPTIPIWEAQTLRLARRLPGLGIPPRPSGIANLYDVTPDWIPIYDKTALSGFYVAIGTSGNQFKNTPILGYLLAEIVEYTENGGDPDDTPLQVRLPRTQLMVDMGHYSRRRALTAQSSFSVMG
jgi:sarcosine oxidase, subunit beta